MGNIISKLKKCEKISLRKIVMGKIKKNMNLKKCKKLFKKLQSLTPDCMSDLVIDILNTLLNTRANIHLPTWFNKHSFMSKFQKNIIKIHQKFVKNRQKKVSRIIFNRSLDNDLHIRLCSESQSLKRWVFNDYFPNKYQKRIF